MNESEQDRSEEDEARDLREWLAEFDRWGRLTDRERDREIRDAVRKAS
jgi:hypothetical protein